LRTDDDNRDVELRSVLHVLRRRIWVVLACAILIPAITYLVSSQRTETYEASTVLQVQAQAVDTSLFEAGTPTQQVPGQALAAAARLVSSPTVAQVAGRKLTPPVRNTKPLTDKITATTDLTAGLLTISARDGSAQGATNLANAFAEALVEVRADQARARIESAIAGVQRDLAALPRSDDGARAALTQELQRLRALGAAQGHNAEIVQPATPPSSAVSPRPVRDAGIALLLSLFAAAGLIYLLERLDRKVRSAEEVERLSGASLLGSIPETAFPGAPPDMAVAEAFRTLRASLTYFNVDRPISTVLVTSPVKGDGKTTVAVHLAAAEAEADRHVVLIDCDLRHPQAATRLGVEAERGVGSVLAGECSVDDALVDVRTGSGRLQLLPAGPPPPNPAELVGSERMRELIESLAERADMVVVDAPPTLVVGDAIPLFREVSGILLVARLNATPRDSVARLGAVVRSARGRILGVIVTGSKSSGLYGYGVYGGYSGNGTSSKDEGSQAAAGFGGRLRSKIRD
jgi:succinoglycan biosynthesis transport protein ExoP